MILCSYHCRFHCLSKQEIHTDMKYAVNYSLALFLARPSFEVSSKTTGIVDSGVHIVVGVSQ
jgi:hypothetical protein